MLVVYTGVFAKKAIQVSGVRRCTYLAHLRLASTVDRVLSMDLTHTAASAPKVSYPIFFLTPAA